MRINSERVKTLIRQTGMTQQEVSRMLGKSKSFIGASVSSGAMSQKTLTQLCPILRTTPDVLTTFEEKKEDSLMPAIHLLFKKLDDVERKLDELLKAAEERKEAACNLLREEKEVV